MSDAHVHIGAWEAAGLIDRATADRLRAADTSSTVQATTATAGSGPAVPHRSAASAMFGPAVTIAEVFGYLGGAFLLAAWSAFMVRTGSGADNEVVLGVMSLVAAAAIAGLGMWLRGASERGSRAAGVAFFLVAVYVGGAVVWFAGAAGIDWPELAIVSTAAALATAIVLRAVHPSVLTQVGVLTWLTALAASILAWVQDAFFTEEFSETTGAVTTSGVDPIVLVIGSAAWWLATAVVVAVIGLREARIGERTNDTARFRRAAISRFWAGLTAVIGLASAVTRSAYVDDEYGRVLEPWVGILALLILSAVLVERAFRRDATSFIYAAALGLIVALSDLNLSYLSDSTEVALLVEGIILLGVGVAADRLRRRVGHPGSEPPTEPAPVEPNVETA